MRKMFLVLNIQALYALGMHVFLLSLVSLMKFDFSFNCSTNGLDILYDGSVFGHASLKNDFLVLDLDDCYNNMSSSVFVSNFGSDFKSIEWHARLGHIDQVSMSRLAKEGLLDLLTKFKLPRCKSCLAGNVTTKPFGKASRPSSPLELIHSDICGPMNVKACHRAFYFLIFIDDYSRHGYVYTLSYHYEALDAFKCFVPEVETQIRMKS